MKRLALALRAAALAAAVAVADDAQGQNVQFIGYFPPGASTMVMNTDVCKPTSSGVSETVPSATFTVEPPSSGMRVQYWIAAPSVDEVRQDVATSGGVSTRPVKYDETMTWDFNQAFPTALSVYLGVRFYYITNSVAYYPGASGDVSGSTAPTGPKSYVDSYALTPNGFSRRGYRFSNWTNELGTSFSDGQVVTGADLGPTNNDQVVNLYAVWTPNAHSVSYDITNGVHGATHPASASYGVAFEVSNPTRTGYTFTGWKVTGGLDRSTSAAQYSNDGETWLPVYSASTQCSAGGDTDSMWFRSLNPTNGAAVTLTAQWTAKTTQVHFNNYNAQGGVTDDKTIAYDETLQSVSVPYWPDGSRLFLGYYSGEGGTGDCYWDDEGQPVKSAWDVTAPGFTLYAYFEEQVYHITYMPNGGNGAPFSVPFTNGTGLVLSDGTAFSRPGHELIGWAEKSDVKTPEYVLGQKKGFKNKQDFNLFAVWKEYYYVAFDGNGATNETPMAVQKFAFDESKALSDNTYGRVGYGFAGWATNAAAAAIRDISYADRQFVKNLAKSAGETNTLFAAWNPISYVTAFNVSAHSSASIAPIDCTYDVAFDLPVLPFQTGDLWKHVGWSNTVANVVYYTNEVTSVSNLCTTAGATNTLFAVWESTVGDLSKAMDIYNLPWSNESAPSDPRSWRVVEGEGFGTPSCVAQTGLPSGRDLWEMTSSVTNSGTLTFWWRTDGESASLIYTSFQGADLTNVQFAASTEWTEVSIDVKFLDSSYDDKRTLSLRPGYAPEAEEDTIYIDRMTWTPEGASVEPTAADVRDISGISFSDGTLSLVFTNADERFSYNLHGTNELVSPLSLWPVLWTTNGTGTITIEPPVVPGETKMFYYLETRKRE